MTNEQFIKVEQLQRDSKQLSDLQEKLRSEFQQSHRVTITNSSELEFVFKLANAALALQLAAI